MTEVHRTHRWRGVVAVALATAAIGVVAGRPNVIFMAVVGGAFVAYPEVVGAPSVDLDFERSVTEATPARDDPVAVTVRVRNLGDDPLVDLRIVDGVPPMLEVIDGTARHAAALRPGEETTFTYSVRAVQGTHRFEPATAIARDVAGTTEVTTELTAETAIECLSSVPDMPLRRQTKHFVGDITTDEGGVGTEFHQTREYHPGDALSRIDWHRFARRGDLATIEFREEQGAAVVLCLDAREPAYRTASPGDPHGVSHAQAAAAQLLEEIAGSSDTVGLASLSDREACYLQPGAGSEHLDHARRLLTTHPSLSKYPPEVADTDHERWDDQLTALRARLGGGEQVVFLTPLTDEFAVEAALTLEAAGHAVTVISPDVSTDASSATAAARAQRNNHIYTLRGSGVRVVDWPTDEPIGAVLVRTEDRWSR